MDTAAEDVKDRVDCTATPEASPAEVENYVPARRGSSWGIGLGLGAAAAAIIFYVLASDRGSKWFPNIQQKLVGSLHLKETTSIVPYQFDFDEDGGLR